MWLARKGITVVKKLFNEQEMVARSCLMSRKCVWLVVNSKKRVGLAFN